MHKLIVGAPFGNWRMLQFAGTTPTLGTFTRYHRGGLLYRLWRMARTLRYNWRSESYINKLGLPNPGLGSVPANADISDKILSIHGFNRDDWMHLAIHLYTCLQHKPEFVELNLSCPNVNHHHSIADVRETIEYLFLYGFKVIAKLPPVRWLDFGAPLYALGVRCFHLCNTIPTPGGGISGKPLKQYSLWAVSDFRQKFGSDVRLIGGGGVSTVEDARQFREAGADHVAVASMLLNPLAWRRVRDIVNYLGD